MRKSTQIPLRRVLRFSRLANLVLPGFSLAEWPFRIQKVKRESSLLTLEIHSQEDGTYKQREAWECSHTSGFSVPQFIYSPAFFPLFSIFHLLMEKMSKATVIIFFFCLKIYQIEKFSEVFSYIPDRQYRCLTSITTIRRPLKVGEVIQ